ncbi:MAG: M81 family metallopeptidase [Geminicoccaceae bacterium]|nr:M81 family metallopeptidase [Geminicoccaceae bacterium]
MRVYAAGLGTESNSFSPVPTGLESFREYLWFEPGTHPEEARFFTGPLVAARARARSEGFTLIEGLHAFAAPAGPTSAETWHRLRARILAELEAASPVDVVLLSLHGAMIAEDCEDCEGELLRAVRARVGERAIVAAELDPHCHLTDQMLAHADILVLYKEYPHTDTLERAEELVDLALRAARGRIRPVMATADCRMLALFHTPREPVRGFVDRMKALEGRDGVLSVSLAHGFPWGDVPDCGARVLVVADGDRERARALARELAREVRAMRGNTTEPVFDLEEGLARALAYPGGPVVVADTADNAGGGAPSDSTFVLARLLATGVERACLGPLWDPVAVRFCHLAGIGARLSLRIGGKVGAVSGPPLDVEAEVVGLARDAEQRFGPGRTRLGDVAAIRIGGIEVLLNSVRTQAFDPALFTAHGIRLDDKKLVVVKSMQHFYAGFAPIAARVLWINGPGALSQDFARLPYRRVRRPIWPLDPPEVAFADAIGG